MKSPENSSHVQLNDSATQMEVDVINVPNEDGTDPLPESSRFKSLPVNNEQIENQGLKMTSWHTDGETSTIATVAVDHATAEASIGSGFVKS